MPTRPDIMKKLDSLGIKYHSKATKPELQQLLDEALPVLRQSLEADSTKTREEVQHNAEEASKKVKAATKLKSENIDLFNMKKVKEILDSFCTGERDKTPQDMFITCLIEESECYSCKDKDKYFDETISTCVRKLLSCRNNGERIDFSSYGNMTSDQMYCILHDPCIHTAYMLLSSDEKRYQKNVDDLISKVRETDADLGWIEKNTIEALRESMNQYLDEYTGKYIYSIIFIKKD